MSYFILESNPSEKSVFIEKSEYPRQILATFKGNSIKHILKNHTINFYIDSSDLIPDDYLSGYMLFPVLSNKFIKLIQDNNSSSIDKYEIYPVTLHFPSNIDTNSHKMLNIMETINGVDRLRSHYTLYPDSDAIDSISRLELNEEMVAGRHLFRVWGLQSKLIISKQLKSAIEKAKLTGIKFTPIEKFIKD